ncbi:MAG: hypothetical protein ACJAUV_000331 [Flavobacteriales bacterium]|jgi:hypothetical protein
MQLLRTLAIIALFYYGFRFLRRVIFPILFKAFIKKAAKKGKAYQETKETRPEGEVHIEYTKDANKKSSDNVGGEYVDFEEIKPE